MPLLANNIIIRETERLEISQVRETGTRAFLTVPAAPPGQPSDNCARARALDDSMRTEPRTQGCRRRRRRRSLTPPPHVLPTRRIAHTRTPRSFARSVSSVAGAAPSGPPAVCVVVRVLYIIILF